MVVTKNKFVAVQKVFNLAEWRYPFLNRSEIAAFFKSSMERFPSRICWKIFSRFPLALYRADVQMLLHRSVDNLLCTPVFDIYGKKNALHLQDGYEHFLSAKAYSGLRFHCTTPLESSA